jgi:type II secretory pathway pseudopilin PulG
MKNRWASAFTVVEILIIVTVIGILAATTVVSYNTIQSRARVSAAQSDLAKIATLMQRTYQQTGSYPQALPSEIQASNDRVTLTLSDSGEYIIYSGLTPIQNGVLFSRICEDLLAEGVGKGVDQGGTTRDYISGCGNWNDDSMQVTGWDTRTWPTPVTEAQLTNYATTYTVSSTFHKQAQETAVKNFYNELVARMNQQGGVFPITSFWDYWAAPGNGGVAYQSIEANGQRSPFYCAQASTNDGADLWHVDQTSKVSEGPCN